MAERTFFLCSFSENPSSDLSFQQCDNHFLGSGSFSTHPLVYGTGNFPATTTPTDLIFKKD